MGYPGGKGRLWRAISIMMPPHDVYIETHLGGGAVLRNKRPAQKNIGIDIDPDVIAAARCWTIPNLELAQEDAVAFIERYPFHGNELVYVDPPYPRSTRKGKRYYRFEYGQEDHLRLLEVLLNLDCAVMISSYPSELYEEKLQSWCAFTLENISHGGRRTEVVWTNFSLTERRHDYSHVGASFRERERIRRKASRLVRNLERLPPLERHAIVAALLRSPLIGTSVAYVLGEMDELQ